MPVIDIHPHIVSPDTQRYPLAPLGGTQSTWSSERPTTYQTLLKAMDDAGVDKAAIVHSSTAYGYDNSYVADAVAAGKLVRLLSDWDFGSAPVIALVPTRKGRSLRIQALLSYLVANLGAEVSGEMPKGR